MEVYGTKPKMFTKDWWEYFWMYYKWHTLAILFIAGVTAVSAVQCAQTPKYDLQADFISETFFSDEQKTALEQLMCDHIGDASGNGKNEAFVLSLNMANTEDVQMNQAMQTKLFLEQGYSESYVFIGTKNYIDWLASAEMFTPVSEWTQGETGNYVSLAGCRALENIGIDTADLYIAVRSVREKDLKKEYQTLQYENGVDFARFLLSER